MAIFKGSQLIWHDDLNGLENEHENKKYIVIFRDENKKIKLFDGKISLHDDLIQIKNNTVNSICFNKNSLICWARWPYFDKNTHKLRFD